MMSEIKKSWVRPQLIILGRGRPEESILLKCKKTPGDPGCTASKKTSGFS
jgi:hypothetical protein